MSYHFWKYKKWPGFQFRDKKKCLLFGKGKFFAADEYGRGKSYFKAKTSLVKTNFLCYLLCYWLIQDYCRWKTCNLINIFRKKSYIWNDIAVSKMLKMGKGFNPLGLNQDLSSSTKFREGLNENCGTGKVG